MDTHIKKALQDDWVDVLRWYRISEVKSGIGAVFRGARGAARSINEYQVQEAILHARGAALKSAPKEAPAETPSPETTAEERARISAEVMAGFVRGRETSSRVEERASGADVDQMISETLEGDCEGGVE